MNFGELFVRMAVDEKAYEKDLDRMQGVTQKRAMTLGGIFKGAFSFALGMGLVSGFRSLAGAVTDFVNTAARTETLNVAFQAVAKSSGYAAGALKEQKNAVMDLGIAEQEATQILTRFMQAQLDTAQASKLARVAQDAAVISGGNSSEAAEQMTEAIAKQQPRLLAQFGMMAGLDEMYGNYAKTVGKTASSLTRMEKKQAMLNYILSEGDKIAGTYEASMGAAGKKIGSLKRYWDTLKNAIATPTALPVLGVLVDGLTNSLKNAVAWAEANESTLRSWGQTAVNVVTMAGRGFAWINGLLSRNWQLIKFAGTALFVYAAATKGAAIATGTLSAVSLALNGQLVAKVPLLGFVSTAMGTYRVQMSLAAAQGIVLTGALAKVRLALYAVHVALGPIGWALLALSGLVAGGMHLWNKYNQSLQKTSSGGMDDLQDSFSGIQGAAGGANDALGDQADALKKAGKAANNNLQPFDEINQLQKDMGGGAGGAGGLLDGLEDLDFGSIGGGGLPGMDWDDMLAGFDEASIPLGERIKGFFGWIWDDVKEKWGTLKSWVSSKVGPMWDGVKKKWGQLKTWAGKLWGDIKTSVSTRWNSLKTSAATTWENIKTSISTRWNSLKTSASSTWESIKTSISTRWNSLKTSASSTWESIKTSVQSRWNSLKTSSGSTWENIRKNIVSKYDSAKTSLAGTGNTIKSNVSSGWNNVISTIKGKATDLRNSMTKPWNDAKTRIGSLVADARSWGRNLIDNIIKGISDKASSLRTSVSNAASTVKNFLGFSSPTKEGPGSDADKWAPNLMMMYAQGILKNAGSVKSAVGTAAGHLQGLTASVAPTIEPSSFASSFAAEDNILSGLADIIATAVRTALAGTQRAAGAATGGGGDVYVYIGNEQIDAYIHRAQDRRNIRSNGR